MSETDPKEIFDIDEFIRISKRAKECRIKRLKEVVKLKLRTGKYLYTIKLSPEEADDVLRKIECKKVEL